MGTWRAGTSRPVDLMRVPASGGEKQFVMRSIYDAYPSVRCAQSVSLCVVAERSPDLKQMIFSELNPGRGRGRELARFRVEITPDAHYQWDLSRDGTRIATLKESEPAITIMSLENGPAEKISVAGSPNLYSLDWNPDGRLLVSALANEGYSLLSVDTKGGVSLLWQTKGSARHPGDVFRSGSLAPRALSSPDGRHLAIQTSSVTSNIWMIENF